MRGKKLFFSSEKTKRTGALPVCYYRLQTLYGTRRIKSVFSLSLNLGERVGVRGLQPVSFTPHPRIKYGAGFNPLPSRGEEILCRTVLSNQVVEN